jgi:hypothetical protein
MKKLVLHILSCAVRIFHLQCDKSGRFALHFFSVSAAILGQLPALVLAENIFFLFLFRVLLAGCPNLFL